MNCLADLPEIFERMQMLADSADTILELGRDTGQIKQHSGLYFRLSSCVGGLRTLLRVHSEDFDELYYDLKGKYDTTA